MPEQQTNGPWTFWGMSSPLIMEEQTPTLMRFRKEPRVSQWNNEQRQKFLSGVKIAFLLIPIAILGLLLATEATYVAITPNAGVIKVINWEAIIRYGGLLVGYIGFLYWLYFLRKPTIWETQPGILRVGKHVLTHKNTDECIINITRRVNTTGSSSNALPYMFGQNNYTAYFITLLAKKKGEKEPQEIAVLATGGGAAQYTSSEEAMLAARFMAEFVIRSTIPFSFTYKDFTPQEDPLAPWKKGPYNVWNEDHREEGNKTKYETYNDYRDAVAYCVQRIQEDLPQYDAYPEDWWITPEPEGLHFDSGALIKFLQSQKVE